MLISNLMRMFPTADDIIGGTHLSCFCSNEPHIDLELLLRIGLLSTDSASDYVPSVNGSLIRFVAKSMPRINLGRWS